MEDNEPLEISSEQSLRGILTHQKALLAEMQKQSSLLKRINFVVQLVGLVLIVALLALVLSSMGVIDLSGLLGGF